MANSIPAPIPLDLTDNAVAAENWQVFKRQWENYITLAESGALSGTRLSTPKLKLAMFNTVIGREGLRLIEKLVDIENSTLNQIIEALDKYFVGIKNSVYERFKFNTLMQHSGESVNDFLGRLKEQVRSCDIAHLSSLNKSELEDSLICDRLIIGLTNIELRRCLLRKKDLKLDEALNICLQHESTDKFVHDMTAGISEETALRVNTKYNTRNNKLCQYCGKLHAKRNCPAFGKFCNICKKKNHFSNVCKSKENIRQIENEDEVQDNSDGNNEDVMQLSSKHKNSSLLN